MNFTAKSLLLMNDRCEKKPSIEISFPKNSDWRKNEAAAHIVYAKVLLDLPHRGALTLEESCGKYYISLELESGSKVTDKEIQKFFDQSIKDLKIVEDFLR